MRSPLERSPMKSSCLDIKRPAKSSLGHILMAGTTPRPYIPELLSASDCLVICELMTRGALHKPTPGRMSWSAVIAQASLSAPLHPCLRQILDKPQLSFRAAVYLRREDTRNYISSPAVYPRSVSANPS